MRAVVTGGAGFVGSHLVDALLASGDRVAVIDHLERGHIHNLEPALARGIDLHRGDVTDVDAMVRILTSARPDVVYHLAAQIDVRRSVRDPSLDAHVNLGGTAAILEAARSAAVSRVVLASTAGVYGDPAALPITESTPISPLSPYGASKAAAETYMSLFRRLHGLSTLCLRMSNVYGPRQDPHGEAGVIAIFCGLAAAGRPAAIFGDGGQTRDFVYVGDVVGAFRAAGRSHAQGALNVSTGRETSLAQLAAQLRLETVNVPGRAGEVRRSCLDPAAACRTLGWEAKMPLGDGLGETLAGMGAPPALRR